MRWRLRTTCAVAAIATSLSLAAPTSATTRQSTLPGSLIGVGNAQQLIVATASSYGSSYATLEAFAHGGSGWHRVMGPWTARVGSRGFAPPGRKREGDLRTPTGSFGFQFAFGVDENPGVHYMWRHAGRDDYWDDDPNSPRYNLWTDIRLHKAGADPEPMHDVPSYEDGIVIGYNLARTPGRGSAIFLHVNNGDATVGCVSLPRNELLQVLRWLRPSKHARIVMGVKSVIDP